MNDPSNAVEGAVLFVLAIYFLPGIVALMRGHMSAGAIIVLNLFLGWTALGWIIALVWSFTSNTRANSGQVPIGLRALRYLDEASQRPTRRVEEAEGEDLDRLARGCRVEPRRDGEDDQSFRVRIMRVVGPHGVWI